MICTGTLKMEAAGSSEMLEKLPTSTRHYYLERESTLPVFLQSLCLINLSEYKALFFTFRLNLDMELLSGVWRQQPIMILKLRSLFSTAQL